MRHIFSAIEDKSRIPVAGDLIRSTNTGDFVNIVLEVYPLYVASFNSYYPIRSVRYGHTNGGDFLLLGGTRSRSIKWYDGTDHWNDWEIVEEYVPSNNLAMRESILNNLKGVNTAYVPRDDEDD